MYKTAVIGLGKIASLYNEDELMLNNIKYATHLQVIEANKNFCLVSAVDPLKDSRDYAKKTWNIKEVKASVSQLSSTEDIEILVLATPPKIRVEILKYFPCIKGIIVEKPLGENLEDATYFLKECERRDILVQVNLTRRSDSVMKQLSGSRY